MFKITMRIEEVLARCNSTPDKVVFATTQIEGVEVIDATAADPMQWVIGAEGPADLVALGQECVHLPSQDMFDGPDAIMDLAVKSIRGTIRPSAQPGHLSE